MGYTTRVVNPAWLWHRCRLGDAQVNPNKTAVQLPVDNRDVLLLGVEDLVNLWGILVVLAPLCRPPIPRQRMSRL